MSAVRLAFAPPRRGQRGQSLIEFAFVIPILLILVIGVADFGRIFAHGLALEAAARDAAEIGANEYLANPPAPLDQPAPAGLATYYDPLHVRAARVVCAELRDLPNANFDPVTTNCPGMPLIAVCVHDGQDPSCGTEVFGSTVPAQCSGMSTMPTNTQSGSTSRWVEVRVCYRFTAFLNLPIMSFADVWLEQSRSFVIPCYFILGTQECG